MMTTVKSRVTAPATQGSSWVPPAVPSMTCMSALQLLLQALLPAGTLGILRQAQLALLAAALQ